MGERFEIGYIADRNGKTIAEAWSFTGDHPSEEVAVSTVALKLGVTVVGERNPNGTLELHLPTTGELVAVVRRLNDPIPETPLGSVPTYRPGTLCRYHGLTWIGWINFLVLRWFFVRVYYIVEDDQSISRYGLHFVPTWRWQSH